MGANPYASNGSLATAPDWPGRMEAIKSRGADGWSWSIRAAVAPRRRRDLHLAIRPGADAFLLAALVTTLAEEGLIDTGADHRSPGRPGRGPCCARRRSPLRPWPHVVGVDAGVIRQLAHDLAAAPSAAVYGRIGTTTAEFGTLTSWLVDLLNVCTGNLDRPGGAMFTRAAVGAANTRGKPQVGRGIRIGRHRSRVRGLSESLGELPAVCMAEEIDTPGEGQIRAMITIAGNPAVSTPNAERLDAALAGLEFMVSVDIYRNETTRHADVILPSPSALQKGHYDIALLQLAIRNVANYSPPALPLEPDQLDEWEVMAKLALILQGMGAARGPCGRRRPDDRVADRQRRRRRAFERARSRPEDLLARAEAAPRSRAPARLHAAHRSVRRRLRHRRGAEPERRPRLNLDVLLANPHGIDLGPLEPRLPEVLRTPSGKVELAPEPLLADVARLAPALDRPVPDFLLVGRRDLRSNNSWMHNVEVLVKGKPRCTLHLHPDDATTPRPGRRCRRHGQQPHRRRCRSRSRSPTRFGRAWSAFPMAGATTATASSWASLAVMPG